MLPPFNTVAIPTIKLFPLLLHNFSIFATVMNYNCILMILVDHWERVIWPQRGPDPQVENFCLRRMSVLDNFQVGVTQLLIVCPALANYPWMLNEVSLSRNTQKTGLICRMWLMEVLWSEAHMNLTSCFSWEQWTSVGGLSLSHKPAPKQPHRGLLITYAQLIA